MSYLPPPLLGVEIGGTKVQLVLGDESCAITARWRGNVDKTKGGPGICKQLESGIRELLKGQTPRAVGVGFGGPIEWKTGRVCKSHHIAGWEGFELCRWLKQLTGAPAFADNDANIGALGEAMRGAGAGVDPVFFCTLGSGVGGGIVSGGIIYHGAPPGEVEFGHMRYDRHTIFEDRCSGWAMDRRIAERIVEYPKSIVAKLCAEKMSGQAKSLVPAVQQKDPVAIALLDEWADDLALALSHVVHLFHPQILVLGGGLSLMGEPARSRVAERLPRYVMEAMHPVPRVAMAGLGEDCVPVGALCLAAMNS